MMEEATEIRRYVYVYHVSIRSELCYITPKEHRTSLKSENHFDILGKFPVLPQLFHRKSKRVRTGTKN